MFKPAAKPFTFTIALSLFLLLKFSGSASARPADFFNINFILPGMTQTIDISQSEHFPFGCANFAVFVIGNGTLGISLVKSDRASDIIYFSGYVLSGTDSFPFYRMGVSKGMISQIMEIGDPNNPYGFVWINAGVLISSVDPPRHVYQLRLSLAP